MDKELVGDYADRMVGGGGDISPFVVSHLLKKMIGDALEAALPTVDAMARAAEAAGERAEGSARGKEGVAVFAPATNSPHHRALAVKDGDGGFVAVVEYASSPDGLDEKMDAIFAERSGRPRKTAAELEAARAARAHEIRQVHVVAFEDGTMGAAIASGVTGGWSPHRQFAVSPGYCYGGPWREGHRDLNSIEGWPRFFPMLHRAVALHGLEAGFAADAKAFSERDYGHRERSEGLEHYDAAEELGGRIAKQTGYRLGEAAVEAMAELEAHCARIDMVRRAQMLDDVHALCAAKGHVSNETAFDHNDLDNWVFAPDGGDGRDYLAFRDQNRALLVAMTRGGDGQIRDIDVYAHRRDPYERAFERALGAVVSGNAGELLLASFRVEEGLVAVRSGPGVAADAVKTWNSFTSDVDTAHCCLEDEYGKAADVAPARRP